MRKVLIIGSIWPYHKGGGARVLGLAEQLPEFGWEPIVVTAPLDKKPDVKFKIIETPSKDILEPWLRLFRLKPDASMSVREQVFRQLGVRSKKSIRRSMIDFAFTRLMEIIYYPDSEKRWKPFALKACTELLQREDVEAIISSSPPVTSHLIARELKVKHEIPWIADFPHLWSQDNSYPYGSLRRMLDRRLEIKTLSQADALVTINKPMAEKLRILHKKQAIYATPHGFDPKTLNLAPDKLTDKFTITYTGSFAPSRREPTKLFVALKRLISEGIIERGRIAVRFYGPPESWIDSDIEKYGLSGIVKQYGKVPLAVSHEKQRESQLLLVPKWQDPQDNSVISMKVYEYLAARRPILAVGGHRDVVDDLLEETGAGVCATSEEDVANTIKELYQEYRQKGEVGFHGDGTRIDKYSRREMMGKFAEILNNLTGI